MSENIIKVKIKDEYIKLDSLLKFSNLVSSGGEAKILIKEGKVKLNGNVCDLRGKKIYAGDKVSLNEKTIEVLKA